MRVVEMLFQDLKKNENYKLYSGTLLLSRRILKKSDTITKQNEIAGPYSPTRYEDSKVKKL